MDGIPYLPFNAEIQRLIPQAFHQKQKCPIHNIGHSNNLTIQILEGVLE